MFNRKIFDKKSENIKSGFYLVNMRNNYYILKILNQWKTDIMLSIDRIGNRNYLIWNESCESNIPSFFYKYID